MTSGISTACLYPEYTEIALKTLASGGVDSIEVFFNCEEEISRPMLHEMKSITENAGTRIISLHPYTSPLEPIMFFSGYKRRFDEGRDMYKAYYEAANILGAELVVFHGGHRAAALSYGEYFDRFGILMEDALKCGNELCHENVERCMSWCPQFFAQMKSALPHAGFVFDIKQAVRAGQDVFDFAEVMGNSIRHVHFSDHDSEHDCLPPGKGIFNTANFLSLISKNGFSGGVIVELYRKNFGDIVELFASYQQLCTEISTQLKNDETYDIIRQAPV